MTSRKASDVTHSVEEIPQGICWPFLESNVSLTERKKNVETQPGTAIFVVEILFKKTTCELIPSDTLKAGASPLIS